MHRLLVGQYTHNEQDDVDGNRYRTVYHSGPIADMFYHNVSGDADVKHNKKQEDAYPFSCGHGFIA